MSGRTKKLRTKLLDSKCFTSYLYRVQQRSLADEQCLNSSQNCKTHSSTQLLNKYLLTYCHKPGIFTGASYVAMTGTGKASASWDLQSRSRRNLRVEGERRNK